MTTITISSTEIQRTVSALFKEGLVMNFGPHLMQVKNSQLRFFSNSGAEATSPPFIYTITFSAPILTSIETSNQATMLSPSEIQLVTRVGKEPKITLHLTP